METIFGWAFFGLVAIGIIYNFAKGWDKKDGGGSNRSSGGGGGYSSSRSSSGRSGGGFDRGRRR